ncbi:MAG: uncharacterized protein JWP85_769 [Rhodoglobus sp.]|nr:uncharacterized protein [Rhodoglobus sp.]
MRDVADYLTENGAVAHVTTLRSAGYPPDRVENAAAAGKVLRVRRGIYASPWASHELVRAARVGGRLAGTSAARAHGIWAPPSRHLVVEVSNSATRLRDPDDASRPLGDRDDVRVLWAPLPRPIAQGLGISPVLETLRQCILTVPEHFAVAIIDSALRTHPIDRTDLAAIQRAVPARFARLFSRVNPAAESGTESVLRVMLGQAGVTARPQVAVPLSDLDRVDLLIGDRLVIECDSEAHHGSRADRLRDLRRDAELAALGFIVLRFDYSQVMFEPDAVLAAVLAYVDRGLHLDLSDG